MSLAEIELGCLCYAIIYEWFNLRAGLSFPVAMDNFSFGPESQSSRQVHSAPGRESSHLGAEEQVQMAQSRHTVIEKNGTFCHPYTHTNWTELNRIGPQPRKSSGNLGNGSSDFQSFWG